MVDEAQGAGAATTVSWRRAPIHSAGRGWLIAAAAIVLLVAVPIAALAIAALDGTPDHWQHLVATVLPQAVADTAMLLAGVACITIAVGTGTAWLVAAHEFPGRRLLEAALLLPLAMPTYIVAYAYLDLLHPVGPVQSALRALLGYAGPRDLRLPDIRSMGGCILLLGFVLYPYVYLTTRAMFLTQAASLIEAGRTLGSRPAALFFRVALPLARPAIAVGASLALMEAINDIGASEFLGVRTLTVAVYTSWVTRNDLPGAAQIALAMLVVVLALVAIERYGRRDHRYASTRRPRPMAPRRLEGLRGWGALALGLLPVLIGFVGPAVYLVDEAWKRMRFAGISPSLLREAANTLTVSAAATALVLVLGMVVAGTGRLAGGRAALLPRLSLIGYAVPGSVLALGILFPVAALDGAIDQAARAWLGVAPGLLLLGSGAALVYAYVTRFLAISVGGIDTGLARISPSLDDAARTLGASPGGTLRRIHLPLCRPAMAAAALLVFVDCTKELSATLLLRPLNFETLATHLYNEAARGTYEEAAIAALCIVLLGILPVAMLARVGRVKPAS